MPRHTGASALPLPKGWPKRVRSAVLHALSLARLVVTFARGNAAKRTRHRLRDEIGRLHQEVALLREEIRIKDVRTGQIPPQRRPHYRPVERMAILELRAARGWSASRTAERFLLTPATIASWMRRLDEEGPKALVQIRQPVNKFPEFVGYIVRRLKVLCPAMGKARIARMLCRAGLHLSSTTVGRMLEEPWKPRPAESAELPLRVVRAKRANHIWHIDLTTVPTSAGFWTAWLPWAMPQRWPFCWWLAVIVDHYSRRVMGIDIFEQVPTSAAMRSFLRKCIGIAGATPSHLITDHGKQFIDAAFRRWCRKRGIQQRFGAVGKYGSLAVIERFIRSMKNECTRRILVPYRETPFRRELSLYAAWYNGHRPHTGLGALTPDEVHYGRPPACLAPRFEPRRRWPRSSPCAQPQAPIRGEPGMRIELRVSYRADRKHLPIAEIRKAA